MGDVASGVSVTRCCNLRFVRVLQRTTLYRFGLVHGEHTALTKETVERPRNCRLQSR
jgi:hypothetical protein